jgi:hypothetical protein
MRSTLITAILRSAAASVMALDPLPRWSIPFWIHHRPS